MKLLYFFWVFSLMGMETEPLLPKTIPESIASILNPPNFSALLKDTKEENNENQALDRYEQRSSTFTTYADGLLDKIRYERNIDLFDPRTTPTGPQNSFLDDVLKNYTWALQLLFLSQKNNNFSALHKIDETILSMVLNLHKAQKHSPFTGDFMKVGVITALENGSKSSTEQEFCLTQPQKYYCLGMYHYFTALYLSACINTGEKESSRKERVQKSFQNYDDCVYNFSIAAMQQAVQTADYYHKELFMQMAAYLICVKNEMQPKDAKEETTLPKRKSQNLMHHHKESKDKEKHPLVPNIDMLLEECAFSRGFNTPEAYDSVAIRKITKQNKKIFELLKIGAVERIPSDLTNRN